MKPVKAIWLVLLLLAGAAIAGVFIGIMVNVSKPSESAAATNVTDATLVYHEHHTPSTPVPAQPPPPGRLARRPILPPRPIPPAAMGINHLPISNQIALSRCHGLDDRFAAARERMVREQPIGRGITDPAVLQAMRTVPRQSFIPSELAADAYVDRTLDDGNGRIIEIPFVIATAAEQLAAEPDDRVLEVQAAPGYATAVHSLLVKPVHATQSFRARTMAIDLQVSRFPQQRLCPAGGRRARLVGGRALRHHCLQ